MEAENMNLVQIEDYFLEFVNKVDRGDANPLDLKIEIKALTEVLEGIDSQISEKVALEGQKWHQQQYRGYRIEYNDSGGRYSYDHIPEWNELKLRMKAIEKNAQISHKALNQNHTMVDEDGAVIEPAVFKYNKPHIKMVKNKEGL